MAGRDLIEKMHKQLASQIVPFYREFPYRGKLIFPRADARGAISVDDHFFYNRVPKAANTTILASLQKISAEKRGVETFKSPRSYFTRPSHLTRGDIAAIKEDFFKFTFVRNPYSRILSAYLDKISSGRGHIWRRWAQAQQVTTVPTFVEFCRYLLTPGLYHDAHWAPQFQCMLMPLDKFDKIGKFENLHSDLNEVLVRIFPTYKPLIKTRGERITNANSKLRDHFNAEAIDIIKHVYHDDFKLFGYSPLFEDIFAHDEPLPL